MLKGKIKAGNLKLFEHQLDESLPVFLGVAGCFGEEDGGIFGGHLKFIEKAMMPHFFHIGPILDNSIDDGFGYV